MTRDSVAFNRNKDQTDHVISRQAALYNNSGLNNNRHSAWSTTIILAGPVALIEYVTEISAASNCRVNERAVASTY